MARRHSKNYEGSHPVDCHVGQRVRLRRTWLGMSQGTLGEKLGITFQQVQKYERGANRISASMLYEIAGALGTSIGYFFEELPEPAASQKSAATLPAQNDIYLTSQEGRKLGSAMASIPRPVRSKLISLAMALRRDDEENEDEEIGESDIVVEKLK